MTSQTSEKNSIVKKIKLDIQISKRNRSNRFYRIKSIELGLNPSDNKLYRSILSALNSINSEVIKADLNGVVIDGTNTYKSIKQSCKNIYDKIKKDAPIYGSALYSEPFIDYVDKNNKIKYSIYIIVNSSAYKVPKKFEPHPKVGQDYYVFEDGKIKKSRRFKVHVDKIMSFNYDNKLAKRLRKEWKSFMNDCPWIHNLETDVFIYGHNEGGDEVAFARSGAGWYSFIGNYRLDVTGKLSKSMMRYIK